MKRLIQKTKLFAIDFLTVHDIAAGFREHLMQLDGLFMPRKMS